MRYFTPVDPCDDADDYRDENEGSIIASLISQLRQVSLCPPARPLRHVCSTHPLVTFAGLTLAP